VACLGNLAGQHLQEVNAMKVFAQFWQMSVAWGDNPSKPIEACGDRAVIILDGRNSSDAWHAIAANEAKKRGYIGYTIHKGDRFEAPAATRLHRVDHKTDLQTISARTQA
jgi:hypothetical protein